MARHHRGLTGTAVFLHAVVCAADGPWMVQGLSGGSPGLLVGRYSGYWNTGKGSTWEGGIHEAAFAYWPGTIAAGSRSSEVVSSLDLFPTASALAGVALPSDRVYDGKDMSDVLLSATGKSKHEVLFFYGGVRIAQDEEEPAARHPQARPHAFVRVPSPMPTRCGPPRSSHRRPHPAPVRDRAPRVWVVGRPIGALALGWAAVRSVRATTTRARESSIRSIGRCSSTCACACERPPNRRTVDGIGTGAQSSALASCSVPMLCVWSVCS
jgi:hypothetical protein